MDAHPSFPACSNPERQLGILIVDDEPAVGLLLEVGLHRLQFAVWVASEGTAAVPLYEQHRAHIHLALLDVRMPGWDGPRKLAALHEVSPDLPCCFMTADPGTYTEEELLEQGAVHVFEKPLRVGEVAQVLRRLVT
jgi:DNA-binding NtrC family response regulator